jgi:DNA polymerase I
MEQDSFKKKSGEKRFVIIDGNNLIHRAFHAIKSLLKTSSGEQTNAVFGFASILLNIIEAEKPDYIALTFDERAPTFRHEENKEYKATRAKAPDELYAQIPRIREMVTRFGIPIFAKEGFEADDMMGTLAKKAEKEGMITYIVTGDMDALQLVSPHTYVVFPHKGYREPIVYDKKRVFEKYGITPEQVIDYKALMGDHSDNIKGVEGIGSVGAVKLLSQYNDLDGIYRHLDEIKGAIHDKLDKGREDAYFAQRMARIVTDVPCEFEKDKAAFGILDFRGFGRFFEEMEMVSLQRRLKKVTPDEQSVGEGQMALF